MERKSENQFRIPVAIKISQPICGRPDERRAISWLCLLLDESSYMADLDSAAPNNQ